MSQVQTVQGPVDAEQIGVTLIHEHLRFRDEATAENWPDRYDADVEREAAVAAVTAARDRGVRTIVDPTAMGGGRDVRFMRDVAQATGVNVVACTGIYSYDHLPQYFVNRDADQVAEHYVSDIEKGIQGTEIKAAFIKTAADEPGITPNVEKLHRAAARASLQTGAPIMCHSHPASGTGPKQVAILLEEGVDPAKIQIAHTGDSDDLDYIEGLLASGVWIGLDRYGLNMFLPRERRDATTAELLRRGHADRLFLSQDHCATIDYFPPEAFEAVFAGGLVEQTWSMTLVLDEVVPWLREQGLFDDATFDQVYVANPRRWLTGT